MSVDLFVYSASDQPVSYSAISGGLRSAGWEAAYLSDWFEVKPSANNAITGGDVVVGWTADPEVGARVRDAISRRDRACLEHMYDQMEIATCALEVCEHTIEEGEEPDPDGMSPAHLHAFNSAKLLYNSRTAAGRSPLSYDLQYAVWQAIGSACSGLLEDPGTGEYRFGHEPPQKPYRSAVESAMEAAIELMPLWAIEWYGGISVAGIVMLFTRLVPTWVAVCLVAQALLALGFYKGWRAVWIAAIAVSVAVVAGGAVATFASSLGLVMVPPVALYAYLLVRLLSAQTRAHFAA